MSEAEVRIAGETGVRAASEAPIDAALSPFRGILPFRYADRHSFFGREREVNDLTAKIALYRLVVLFGESGSGKSSLLNAGVIPRLIAEGFSVDRLNVRPFDAEPLLMDRRALGDSTGSDVPSVFGPPKVDRAGAIVNTACSLEQFEERLAATDHGRIPVLIFDQFEELFTLFAQAQRALQEEILDLIYRLIEGRVSGNARTISVKVVLGIREDFLGKLEVLSRRYPQILDRRVRLGLLSASGARQAILRPFGYKPADGDQPETRDSGATRRFKSEMTPDLATAIVTGFGAGETDVAINPTHLQIVCSQLWDRFSIDAAAANESRSETVKRVETIQPDHFARLGSIEGIWKGFLGAELDKLPGAERAAASRILGELVTDAGTRDVVSEQRLADNVKAKTFHSSIKQLEERRLINRTPQGQTYYYEIASEFLVAPIREQNVARQREAAVWKTTKRAGLTGIGLVLLFGVILFVTQLLTERRQVAESRSRLSDVMVGIAASRESGGRTGEGLAYLARALDLNPLNQAARSAVLNQLLYRNWPAPRGLVKHEHAVRWVEFSSDGGRIVTAAGDSAVQIFSVPAGTPIGQPLSHPGDATVSLAHFDRTGTRVLTVASDGIARLWDAESGRMVQAFQPGQDQQVVKVTAAAISPDGTRIGTGASDGSVQIWRAQSGARVLTVSSGIGAVTDIQFSHNGARLLVTAGHVRVMDAATGRPGVDLRLDAIVFTAQFSADDQRILTASKDGTARIWNARTGSEALSVPHDEIVWSAQFGPSDATLVTASEDGTARLWDSVTGRPIGPPMRHGGPVLAASFAPDGDRIITASRDLSARVWSSETAELIAEPMWHAAAVNFARFSPNGQYAVTASDDGSARIWDVRAGAALPLTLQASGVRAAQFAPDGKRVVAATTAGQAIVWDTSSPGAEPRVINVDGPSTWSEFSRDGTTILTVAGQAARAWDAATLAPRGEPLLHEYGSIVSARLSADGRQVVTASTDRTAVLWDLLSGRKLTTLAGHAGSLWFAELDPDGRRVVTASSDFTARLWDAGSGNNLQPFRHEDEVFVARFSPDGRRILTASADRTARTWNANDGGPLHTMSHGDDVVQARFSPDGRLVVTASVDRTARLWDADSGDAIGPAMVHNAAVDGVSFSPDSTRLVTGSRDGVVRVWDVRTSTAISPPLRHHGSMYSLQFDSTGGAIVCASDDGRVRVWTLPTGEASDAAFLIKAAEAVGRFTLNDRDAAVAARESGNAPTLQEGNLTLPPESSMLVGRIAQWLLADRATRMISPFSGVTVEEFVKTLLKDSNPIAGRREAVLALPGDSRIPPGTVRISVPPEARNRSNR